MNPATPETYVVEANAQAPSRYTKTPILGWIINEKRPIPMTMHGINCLVGGTAVLFPGGMVHSPDDALAFDSVDEWLGSSPGKPKRNVAALTPKVVKSAEPEEEEAGEESPYDIVWISKPFKSKSFWSYDDGEYAFVFTVEPGEDIPVASDLVTKVKRDEMMLLKKSVDALSVADIMSADPLSIDEEAEEEEEEDDDDSGGLI